MTENHSANDPFKPMASRPSQQGGLLLETQLRVLEPPNKNFGGIFVFQKLAFSEFLSLNGGKISCFLVADSCLPSTLYSLKPCLPGQLQTQARKTTFYSEMCKRLCSINRKVAMEVHKHYLGSDCWFILQQMWTESNIVAMKNVTCSDCQNQCCRVWWP